SPATSGNAHCCSRGRRHVREGRPRRRRRDKMRYLCLIYLKEEEMDAMPAREMSELNARHLDFNDGLRISGHYIEAEALDPARSTACVRVRQQKASVTDGPF